MLTLICDVVVFRSDDLYRSTCIQDCLASVAAAIRDGEIRFDDSDALYGRNTQLE